VFSLDVLATERNNEMQIRQEKTKTKTKKYYSKNRKVERVITTK
jgi:hypothetical protein